MNFIVTYGVKCPGAGTFVLDCQLDSVYISGVGTSVTGGAPTGTRSINTLGSGMSGTYTVGGTTPNFATLALAVADVNNRGLSGPVVLEVRKGHSERATAAAGIVLDVNPPIACGVTRPNKINTLTIRRAAGTGAMPIIYAASTGTNSPGLGSTTPDGIFKINGEDYVTIDGISFRDTSINTGTAKSEYGIMLAKKNANDACKRVIIRNCFIRLDRTNVGTVFNNRMGGGAVGILVTNVDGLGNSSLIPIVNNGTVDSVLIRNNTITNVYHPILWYGIESSDRNYFWKDNRDSIVNNTLNNFGGSTVQTDGILMMGANNYFISGNTINNKANSGVDHLQSTGTSMFGIRLAVGTSNTTSAENFSGGTITNNTIVWNVAPTASSTLSPMGGIGIYTGGRNNNLLVRGNRFINSNFNLNTFGTMYGVYLARSAHYNRLEISRNRMSGINVNSTATIYGYFTESSVAKNRIIENDTFANITNGGSSTGSIYGIWSSNSSTTPGLIDSSVSISNN
ncbi:MAG: hypothetical protein ACKO6I_08735, partial [Sphingomonadales bacterium]